MTSFCCDGIIKDANFYLFICNEEELMNSLQFEQLTERNNRIIKAVIQKSESICPGSVALIGIYGSFLTGDIHDKSDLDLFIVINDADGWKIATCFILDDVGHDIYCNSWEYLEKSTLEITPHLSRILDSKIVYAPDTKSVQRLDQLRNQILTRLETPLGHDDMIPIKKYLAQATTALGNLTIVDSLAEARQYQVKLLEAVESAICLLNKTYFKKSIKRIKEELSEMKKLPIDFIHQYDQLIYVRTLDELIISSRSLIASLSQYLETVTQSLALEKSKTTADALRASYEEIFSNWRHKLTLAIKTNNAHLALMTLGSCQSFYDEMYEQYEMPHFEVISYFDAYDLVKTENHFMKVLDEYLKEYNKVGLSPVKYDSIKAFENDYLG